jgi:hypothetical protein
MALDRIDSGQGQLPDGYKPQFQGARPAPAGGTPTSATTHLTIQVTAPSDVGRGVDEGGWAGDY